MRTGDSRALRTSGGASVAELLGCALLAGQALRPGAALLRKALLSGKTLLSRRAARTLLAELLGLALSTRAPLTGAALARSALLSLLELRTTRGLLA